MVRIAPVSSAFLVAASVLTLCNAHLEYKVRVRNLTYQQPFSPILVFAHSEAIQAFEVGLSVSPQFRAMAEEGDLSLLLAQADDAIAAPFLCGLAYGSELLEPGDDETFNLVVDEEICPDGALFTMVSMLVNTNDAFVGIDSAPMKTCSSMTIYPPAYDAGTEANNELCSHIPGPACGASSGNLQDEPGEGFVHVHRGFHGVGDRLLAADYAWENPVAEVFIDEPTTH